MGIKLLSECRSYGILGKLSSATREDSKRHSNLTTMDVKDISLLLIPMCVCFSFRGNVASVSLFQRTGVWPSTWTRTRTCSLGRMFMRAFQETDIIDLFMHTYISRAQRVWRPRFPPFPPFPRPLYRVHLGRLSLDSRLLSDCVPCSISAFPPSFNLNAISYSMELRIQNCLVSL